MLIATRGLPASGKTSWAKAQQAAAEPGEVVRLNRDDLRDALHGGTLLQHITESQVTAVQHGGVDKLLRSGATVIVDDTNLRSKFLRNLAQIAWTAGVEFEVKDFTHVQLEECLRRNADRGYLVPEHAIRGMYDKFIAGKKLPLPIPEKPDVVAGEPYVPDVRLTPAVMVDVDGTVALHGDRDPYDASRCHEDKPNLPVIRTVDTLRQSGYDVLFCSARPEDYRLETREWLEEHVEGPFALHMRKSGDLRRDDVVKLEMFDREIRHLWNVVAVFDDRDRVVRAWRSIGLTVFQVAEGNF